MVPCPVRQLCHWPSPPVLRCRRRSPPPRPVSVIRAGGRCRKPSTGLQLDIERWPVIPPLSSASPGPEPALSTQLRYLQSYSAVVQGYLAAYPEDEAMAWAVGGGLETFERFGVLEHSLLRMFGLRDDSRVVDVGCGAGRLARQLARCPDMRYFGIDVVKELLDYTLRKVTRPDFAFQLVAGNTVPVADAPAGSATFFSASPHPAPP